MPPFVILGLACPRTCSEGAENPHEARHWSSRTVAHYGPGHAACRADATMQPRLSAHPAMSTDCASRGFRSLRRRTRIDVAGRTTTANNHGERPPDQDHRPQGLELAERCGIGLQEGRRGVEAEQGHDGQRGQPPDGGMRVLIPCWRSQKKMASDVANSTIVTQPSITPARPPERTAAAPGTDVHAGHSQYVTARDASAHPAANAVIVELRAKAISSPPARRRRRATPAPRAWSSWRDEIGRSRKPSGSMRTESTSRR